MSGFVYLIGAGPGAPDLLTLRALRAVQQADIIIADKILGHGFVASLGIDTSAKEIIWLGCMGPVAGRQEGLNQQLVDAAKLGKVVARLKNGDPLVFGRGAEEAAYLDQHGVGWEFIPGLSSAISVCTNAGFPITNRGLGRSFAIVSARLAGGGLNLTIPADAETLVIFMGLEVMPTVRQDLYQRGRGPETPALVIERGTLPYEKRLRGTLANILDLAHAAGISSPALFIIGAAAETCYRSPLRPVLLTPAPDHLGYRQRADLLYWPLRQASDPTPDLVDQVLPPAEGVLFTSTKQIDGWWQQHGPAAGRLIVSDPEVATYLTAMVDDPATVEVWPRHGLASA